MRLRLRSVPSYREDSPINVVGEPGLSSPEPTKNWPISSTTDAVSNVEPTLVAKDVRVKIEEPFSPPRSVPREAHHRFDNESCGTNIDVDSIEGQSYLLHKEVERSTSRDPRVLVIGAGMSGLLMAIKLKQAGYDNFTLCEKSAEIGGVWRDNTYPGLKCDIPAHMYTFSFESNPDYQQRFAAGSEIFEYFQRVTKKFDLRSKIQFNTSIESAIFDESNGRWVLTTQTGEVLSADVVIWAGGILHQPKLPNIPGRESFSGTSFHTARWNHSVNLSDKRVGIIGTGSTGVQVVPAIVNQTKHLTVFQRTPHWIFPLPNRHYRAASQNHVRSWPGYAKFLRWSYSQLFQWTFARAVTGNKLLQKYMQWQSQNFLNRKVKDPELRKRLTPDYKAGCKRMILARGFYEAIQRPNVTFSDQEIQKIVHDGIVMKDGTHHPLDVLVYATGFQAHNYMRPMQVVGLQGKTIDDTWKDSIYAHRSVAIPGFPNFFMILGPQSPIGNFSAISVAETQVDYLMQLIERIRSGTCDLVDPKIAVTQHLSEKIATGMKKTVWVSGCNSWYLGENGKTTMWPWTFERFRKELKRPDFSEFVLTSRPSETFPAMPTKSKQSLYYSGRALLEDDRKPKSDANVVSVP